VSPQATATAGHDQASAESLMAFRQSSRLWTESDSRSPALETAAAVGLILPSTAKVKIRQWVALDFFPTSTGTGWRMPAGGSWKEPRPATPLRNWSCCSSSSLVRTVSRKFLES